MQPHRLGQLLSASSIIVAATLSTSAQRAAGPPVAHENLKVLPADIPQPQLLQTMQGFTQALGVQCGYCHMSAPAPEGGRGGGQGRGRGPAAPQFNYASDDKPAKKAAREMMGIVRDLNARVPAAVSKPTDAAVRVQCVTCHHGVAIPKQLPDVLTETAMDTGNAAAIAQYKDLRKRYFGAQAYDFSEMTLVNLAQRTQVPDEAVAWLRLNLEYFPFSSRTFAALGQLQQKQSDKEGALKNLTRAVELDPQNAQAKRQLDALKEAK